MAGVQIGTAQTLGQPLSSVIARARRRIRLQRAVTRGVTAVIPTALLLLIVLVLYKLDEVGEAGMLAGGVIGAALIAATLLAAYLWPVSQVAAARAVDVHADLADRIGSAWDFSHQRERSPFMEAAIRDAASKTSGLRVGRLLRLGRPADLPMAAVLVVAVLIVLALRFPPPLALGLAGDGPAAQKPPVVPPFQALLAQAKLKETERRAEKAKDPQLKRMAKRLKNLWKNIASRQFDKRELWKRIAALQAKRLKGLTSAEKQEMGRLRKLGQGLGKASPASKLADALKKGDLARAQQALRQLARKLRQRQLTKKQRKQLQRALRKATKETKRQLRSLRRKLDKLRKEQKKRRLQKLSRNRKQRELERLSRQLEKLRSMLSTQLSQELMKALQQMRRYADGDAGRSLERAAQRLQKLLKQLQRQQLMRRLRNHIREMKELLRRGNQGERDQQLKQFHKRAGGGEGDLTLLLPGGEKPGQAAGQKPGSCSRCGGNHPTNQHGQPGGKQGGKQGGQNNQVSNRPGNKAGTGTGQRRGDPTDLKGKYRQHRLKGKKGRGEVTSEIFYGAATKGFSRVAYRRVYNRYREVVEEALEKNKRIPHGYKRIVEKYFEMIRPK